MIFLQTCSRDGLVVRSLYTCYQGWGFELPSRLVAKSARRAFANSLQFQAKRQKESRCVVTSRGRTSFALLKSTLDLRLQVHTHYRVFERWYLLTALACNWYKQGINHLKDTCVKVNSVTQWCAHISSTLATVCLLQQVFFTFLFIIIDN